MKKIKSSLIISFILLMIANCAVASVIIPYASEEIHAASVALSARKRVTFDVVVKKTKLQSSCELLRSL